MKLETELHVTEKMDEIKIKDAIDGILSSIEALGKTQRSEAWWIGYNRYYIFMRSFAGKPMYGGCLSCEKIREETRLFLKKVIDDCKKILDGKTENNLEDCGDSLALDDYSHSCRRVVIEGSEKTLTIKTYCGKSLCDGIAFAPDRDDVANKESENEEHNV